jgi:hypothetical protein
VLKVEKKIITSAGKPFAKIKTNPWQLEKIYLQTTDSPLGNWCSGFWLDISGVINKMNLYRAIWLFI